MASSKAARGIRPNERTLKLRQNVSGMAQNRAETFLRPDQAVDILNMHATEEGSWSADNAGYTVINSGGTAYESGAAIDGMAVFTDSAGDDHLFIAINGKIKEVDTGAGTAADVDASAGFTVGNKVDFLAINDVLISVDGAIASPRKWDGTTAADLTGWPVSDGVNTFQKPKYCEQHQGRAAFANFEDFPDYLILSEFEDAESYRLSGVGPTAALIIQIGAGDGDPIIGMKTIHIPASNESQLVIFKQRSTFVLVGKSAQSGDADEFKAIELNESYGSLNNNCTIQVGNDILTLNLFGVTSYSTANQSGTLQPLAINSDNVKDVIGDINQNALAQCWGIHLPHRREVMWFMPTGASSQCNEAIVYKYPSPGAQDELPKWSRRMDSGSAFKMAAGCLLDTDFYIGSYGGKVGTMFTASTYNGTAIPWRYEYPYWDLGNEMQNKRIALAFAHFKVRSNQTAAMQTIWKGGGCNDQASGTIAINTTTSGAVYGTGVYGTDYYGAQEEVKVMFDIPGDGLRLKIVLSGNTTTTGPEFLGITLKPQMGNISGHWN